MHLHSGTKGDAYEALASRLDKNVLGAPLSDTLIEILRTLWTESEAGIGGAFPLRSVTLTSLAAETGLSEQELQGHLRSMIAKGLVYDYDVDGQTHFELQQTVFGFFAYTFMRADHERVPLAHLAELFERYFSEPGVIAEFNNANGATKMMRVVANEQAMPQDITSEVLPYERASEIIRSSGHGALGICYCRHEQQHAGTKQCSAPVEEVCMSFGDYAHWMVARGFAKSATNAELLEKLDEARALGLMHTVDNVRNEPAFMCHCCGCCCGSLRSYNVHGIVGFSSSNFISRVDRSRCSGCGICVERCHVGAIDVFEPADAHDSSAAGALVNEARCLGCGVCADGCPDGAIDLIRREPVTEPPADVEEKMARIAREKGKQDYLLALDT